MKYVIKGIHNNRYIAGFTDESARWTSYEKSGKRYYSREEANLITMGLQHKYAYRCNVILLKEEKNKC